MPRKNKTEAHWQTVFNQYCREKKIYGFFELKFTLINSLPFSKIEIVQYDGLQATEKNGLVWKLSDEISRPKPCDSFSIPPLPSYVVIIFKDTFYMIRIGTIVDMRESGLISITRDQAEKLAEKIIKIEK